MIQLNSLLNDLKNYQRIFPAIQHSFQGLKSTFDSEVAFRQEVLLSTIVIPLAFFIGNTGLEKGLLIVSWLWILIAELLNTAIEFTIDRISKDQHELSGKAKDCGSAAVSMSIVAAAVVWLFVIMG